MVRTILLGMEPNKENNPIEPTKEEPKLLTVSQAATQADMPIQSVYTAIRRKKLPAQDFYGKVLITQDALDKYLADKPERKKKQAGAEEPNTDTQH